MQSDSLSLSLSASPQSGKGIKEILEVLGHLSDVFTRSQFNQKAIHATS